MLGADGYTNPTTGIDVLRALKGDFVLFWGTFLLE